MWASRVSWARGATGTWNESVRVSSPSFFLTSTRNPGSGGTRAPAAARRRDARATRRRPRRARGRRRGFPCSSRASLPPLPNARGRESSRGLRGRLPLWYFARWERPARGCCGKRFMPHFITDTCIGCGVCEIKCPTHTITGDKNEKYVIHHDRCIDCSVCARYCPVSCIQDQKGELVEKVKPQGHPQGDRRPGPLHGLRVLHRHLPVRLHLPDRRPAPRDLPQDRRGGRRALRLLPALRDRLREGRHLRPQPDHPGEAVPARPVTETPRDAAPPDDDERGGGAPRRRAPDRPVLPPAAAGRRGRGRHLPRLQPHDVRAAQPARLPPGSPGRDRQPPLAGGLRALPLARQPAARGARRR